MDGTRDILLQRQTVNSYSENQGFINSNSKQYLPVHVKRFVETLDKRLVRDIKWFSFYCKAARNLGFSRVNDLQKMVTSDPRMGAPLTVFNPEKVFAALLRDELKAKGN